MGRKRGRESFLLTGAAEPRIVVDMPRRHRVASGGYVYHVLNRGVARAAIFEKDDERKGVGSLSS
jgi:hypothetical protein